MVYVQEVLDINFFEFLLLGFWSFGIFSVYVYWLIDWLFLSFVALFVCLFVCLFVFIGMNTRQLRKYKVSAHEILKKRNKCLLASFSIQKKTKIYLHRILKPAIVDG